jgi:hypothetical protein
VDNRAQNTFANQFYVHDLFRSSRPLEAKFCYIKNFQQTLTIHGHLIDLRRVVLFNVAQNADVVSFDKIDRHTFAAVTTRATNSKNLKFTN